MALMSNISVTAMLVWVLSGSAQTLPLPVHTVPAYRPVASVRVERARTMEPPAGHPANTCQPGQLTISPSGGAAGVGHVGIEFLLTNHSTQSCTLFGYPGAQLLTSARQPLPTTVRWTSGYLSGRRPLRLITLVPSGVAFVTLEWVHIPAAGQRCPAAPFVQITPPNDDASVLVSLAPLTIDACGGILTASPVEPTPFLGFGVPHGGGPAPGRYLVRVAMRARSGPVDTAILVPEQLVYSGAVLAGTGVVSGAWVQVIAGGRPIWLYAPNLRALPPVT